MSCVARMAPHNGRALVGALATCIAGAANDQADSGANGIAAACRAAAVRIASVKSGISTRVSRVVVGLFSFVVMR